MLVVPFVLIWEWVLAQARELELLSAEGPYLALLTSKLLTALGTDQQLLQILLNNGCQIRLTINNNQHEEYRMDSQRPCRPQRHCGIQVRLRLNHICEEARLRPRLYL